MTADTPDGTIPAYTNETLIGWADKIDNRLGPISGADADQLARLLRSTAARLKQLKTDRDDQDRALAEAIRETVAVVDAKRQGMHDLDDVIGKLSAAALQISPKDDQIIGDHIRGSVAMLLKARHKLRGEDQ